MSSIVGMYEQISLGIRVRVNDWTAELTTAASNVKPQKTSKHINLGYVCRELGSTSAGSPVIMAPVTRS